MWSDSHTHTHTLKKIPVKNYITCVGLAGTHTHTLLDYNSLLLQFVCEDTPLFLFVRDRAELGAGEDNTRPWVFSEVKQTTSTSEHKYGPLLRALGTTRDRWLAPHEGRGEQLVGRERTCTHGSDSTIIS